MIALLADLFQNAPPQAIVGFVLFCLVVIAGPVCLVVGGCQAFYNEPGRVMRRRLRRRRR
jgi:hypothetical protein